METVSALILIGTLFLTLIIAVGGFIIYTAQQKKHKLEVELHEEQISRHKEIAVNTLRSQEQERRRIGLDLHDELGPAFSVVKMNLSRIKQKLDSGKDLQTVVQLAGETSGNLEMAIEKFSNLSKLLYPVILTRYGLLKAVEDILERSFARSSIEVNADLQEISTDSELMTLSIYRVFQELAHNTLKHSQANKVELSLNDDEQFIYITYKDNGIGFDLNNLKPGLGIDSINGRMDAIGGKVEMITSPNNGLEVKIQIPHEGTH